MAYWRGHPSVLIDPPGKTATTETDATTLSTEVTGDLPHKIDMVGISATGFSPELVMSFEDGKVTTEPLAGTRANVGMEKEQVRLRNDLLNDPKEVIERMSSQSREKCGK
ncbi:uncharacterized protein APUU_60267A [Aspergillus puulaauensis]|uniref:Chorismate-utilising enzyme C-terminal domain-containing protein n=1 Tax=Aspergillus puulaauensis TaxID=1220207 RepID=A0A7R8APK6_9EURO|nr:uncharacterized protein APUU_60267A [Aspergillus puulaauensis]BCS27219.1 hypothetical protein APUU_60267A [Aspergillus puulaauensis]